jgi:lysyl endopeptidase
MKRTITKLFAFICALTISCSSFAQLSEGGTPYAFTHTSVQTKTTLQKEVLFQPDLTVLSAQDAINDVAKDSPYRVGINIPVNYNTNNSGNWETTADGGSLWRLRVESPDAHALSLYFHNFFLPTGSKVFVYNEGENHVIGAFTDASNFQNTIRATQMIEGDILTIEYYAPAGTVGSPVIEVKEVVYFYRGVEDFTRPIKEEVEGPSNAVSLKADGCQVDVACAPENVGHADIINSAVHYSFSSGGGTAVCSASMVNNTSQDCTPYILTAWHCGEPNAGSNISSYVWYWNYQKTTCSPNSNGSDPSRGTDTMTGGTVVASSGSGTLNNPPGTNQLAGSDFFLVQLGAEPPVSYNAFYAGWDRTNSAATSGVGIHHPAGSAKKISTYTGNLTSSSYNGGAANTHWVVTWTATTNGHGVTEGGSSGSPIFNSSDRVVGQLSGGSSFCTNVNASDLYGKMFTNWDLCGTANNARLKPWLDPANTGANFMDGAYQPCSSTSPPTCGINASTMTVGVGGTVNFTDASSGVPTSWAWNFDNTTLGGATPSTSSVQNPGNVTFNNIGTYQVELTATNANGSCTTTVNVVVTASTGCDTLLNIADTNTLTIYGSGNGGFITGTNGYSDLAKAEKYTGYSPYTHVTGSDIFFYGVQDGGNGATVDLTIWNDNAGLPGTVIDVVSYTLSSIETALAANSGQGLLYLAFNAPVNVAGNDFYIGVDMSSFGAGDTIGIVSKLITVATPANTAYEQWSDLSWNDMQTAWGGSGPFSLYITARVTDLPVSGTVSGPATGCTNTALTLTASGTNSTDFDWFAPNGVLSNDSLATTTVTYAAPGTYTVYTYINGTCSGQFLDSLQIVISGGPTVSTVGNDPSCAGNDGDIAITATGTGPFMYSIDGGVTFQTGFNFPNLSSGTFNIVVQDANGCEATDVITLTGAAGGATLSVATVDPSCGASDGQITITATGTGPFLYSIDGGVTTQAGNVFTGLAVGSYNIEVTDGGGCATTATASLNSAGGPTLTATGTNLSCFGASDGTITATATGGAGGNTYSLDGITFVSGNVFTGQAASSYTVYVEDLNGCQATASVTITEPAQIVFTASGIDASCGSANGSINATATGGAGSFMYTLNGGTNQASGAFSSLAAGTYTVAVTDMNGCSENTSVVISGTASPVPTASVVDETCLNANGSITVSATGGQTPLQYSIDGGMTYQAGTMFSGLSAGTYAVMVQDATGCTGTTNVSVSNTGGFNMNISNAQTICSGNSATITASGAGVGGSYVWDNGLPATATHTVSPAITTTYSVIATDAGGCSQNGTVVVTVETIPTVTVVPVNPEICSGDAITLVASGAQTYIWNNGTTAATLTVTPSSQSTYTVIGQNGSCSGAPVQTTVLVNAAPTIIASSDVFNIPVGGTVNFSNAGSSATGYTWTFGDGNTSTQGTVAHTYNVMGTYTATLTGSIGDCFASDVIIVNVGVVDVPQIDLEQAVTVYPNPNNGQFNLKLDLNSAENVSIELFSSIGQLVASQVLGSVNNAVLNFDLSNEAEGFYFVKVTTSAGTVTKTITLVK